MKFFKHKSFLVLLCLLLGSALAFGQRQVTGTVTDAETGEALIGATVKVVGTAAGTATDYNGQFRFEAPAGATQLEISYTGYSSTTVDIGSGTVEARLTAGVALAETVIIGYGTVKREDATGALTSLSTRNFNKGALASPQELLVGKIAGVQVTPNADPGGGASILIRGGSSISATNDPLIVIDGVPMDNRSVAGERSSYNIVNPTDIETFTVLKDASATAIYGSRASNGVILITTKKGNVGRKIGIDFSADFSFSKRLNEVDVLTADEYRDLINTRYADNAAVKDLLGPANTDWQSQVYQTGVGQDYNLGISGSAGFLPYRVSMGYTDRNGVIKTDEFNRLTGAVNLSPGFFNNTLQVNLNLKGMKVKNRFANKDAIGTAVRFDPTQPVYDPDSPYGGYYTIVQNDGTPNPIAPHNPLAQLELKEERADVNRLMGNIQLDYRLGFFPDLRANLNVGYDRSTSDGTVIEPKYAAFAFVNGGQDKTYTEEKKNKVLEFYLNYVKNVGKVRLDLMGGYSWQHFFYENYSVSYNSDRTKLLQPENLDPREYYIVSLFGRANFTLFDRLLLTFTLRRDGSSRFSKDNRWGMFPSGALAFKIVDDRRGVMNNLKLRLSYGKTGQQDIDKDLYPYLARYERSLETALYQLGDTYYFTQRPNGYDANIKWEETATYNVGMDFGFLDNRLSGSLEWYYRKTTDLINFVPVAAGSNLSNFIYTNVGDLENRGVEFSLSTLPVKRPNFSWEIGGNVTVNQNKITRLTATDDPNYVGVLTGGISGGVGNNIQIYSVGHPSKSFYVYQQVYDSVGVPVEDLYVDQNGDGVINQKDQYRYKKPFANVLFGFYTNVTLGKWDLGIGGRASLGNYVYNNNLVERSHYNNLYSSTGFLSNIHADYASIDMTVPRYFSDHYVQDASFVRFDHITLGYNFSRLGVLKNLRLRAAVQNPFVFTSYKGLDPEVFDGIDNNVYPRSRTFLFGLNANF